MQRAAFLPLLVLALAGCLGSEPDYRRYLTVAAAVAAGENGYLGLPAWLPASATDLYLQGDLRTGGRRIRADLTPAAADSLRRLLVPVDPAEVRPWRPRYDRSWWFEGLVQQQPENDAALNANLFHGTGRPVPRSTVVAFDRFSPRVYVWTEGYGRNKPWRRNRRLQAGDDSL